MLTLLARVRQVWIAPVLFLGLFGLGLAPAADGDLWWHLAAAREMVRTHTLLTSDLFSISASGRPWANVHWLFQLGLYAVYQLGGLTGLVWAKCLLVGSGGLLLLGALGRRPSERTRLLSVVTAVLLLGALLAARQLLLVRPVIVTLVFLAIFFRQLERFRRDGRKVDLLPLPFIQILWANCQGLFALGPALVLAYAIGALAFTLAGQRRWFPFAPEWSPLHPAPNRFRSLAIALAICMGSSGVTPYGFPSAALPVKLFARLLPTEGNLYADNVAENIPPFALERMQPGQFWHLKWFLGLLFLCLVFSAGRLLLSHMLMLAGFVGLALLANRNVLLLYWMATPIAAMNGAPALRRAIIYLFRRRGARAAAWAGRAALAALFLAVGTAAAREPPLGAPLPFQMPVASARIIGSLPGEGAIFAADHHGGYLIWTLYPRYRPYIDTRLVLRSAPEFAEYLELADMPERFDEFQQRHPFAFVVLPVAYPDRYLALIAHLYRSLDWKLIYTDGAEVLFARRTPGEDDAWDLGSSTATARILANADQRFRGAPRLLARARLQFATLDIALGHFEEAQRILHDMPSVEADSLRARCLLAAGDLDGAADIGERMLQADDRDIRVLDLLAMVHARRGQLQQATTFIRRALALDPFDGEATSLLASMEEQHENQ